MPSQGGSRWENENPERMRSFLGETGAAKKRRKKVFVGPRLGVAFELFMNND
jgi:hypothetical protein